MNTNAKKWVKALRSGKFDQTAGTLHDGNGYCCLGVACELAKAETGVGYRDADLPPERVRRWLRSQNEGRPDHGDGFLG